MMLMNPPYITISGKEERIPYSFHGFKGLNKSELDLDLSRSLKLNSDCIPGFHRFHISDQLQHLP